MTRVVRAGLVLAVLIALGAVAVLWYVTGATPYVRDRVVESLNARFDSHVELAALEVSVFPKPSIAGRGLVLRRNGPGDPPLLTIPAFAASAGFVGLRSTPLRLSTVELEGLTVRIPKGAMKMDASPSEATGTDSPGKETTPVPSGPTLLTIDRIVTRAASLEIEPGDPTKLPRRFDIHNLEMDSWGGPSGSPFRASLTNPIPRGQVNTEGTFGPWRTDNPRATPVRGSYLFGSANLDSIKGIGGTLSSGGTYTGVLERIVVSGHTETPDFEIDLARQRVPLTTRFDAVVDGTNGDTWLEHVEATLRSTTIFASGAVVRATDVKGRRVSLDVTIDDGHLEDVLALAVNASQPPLTGKMSLKTRMVIPAGDKDVVDKLQLDGQFALAEARFANLDVQRRVNTLSQKGRADTEGHERDSVVSNLKGRFVMRDAAIRFSQLTFAVPGAIVQLAGLYNLRSEVIDFSGELLLDATLAQMTTGFKSVLARLAQPFFRRPGGGTKLPIRISGTRSKPSFGLDVKRAFLPG